jgi:uncharacterized membrane protein
MRRATVKRNPNFEGIQKMKGKAEDKSKLRHESLQLHRLERMVDVVYAIIIWRAFMLLPRPTAEQLSWEQIGAFLSTNIGSFVLVIIAIFITIIYWIQNNVLFGNLQATDSRHTILSILQLFFLLVFLVSLRLSIELGASTATRAFESFAAVLVGISGGWGWSYAINNHRLLLAEVSEQYAYRLKDRILAEPITALITLPFAFVGPILWEISWLSYPLVVKLVRGRRRAKKV